MDAAAIVFALKPPSDFVSKVAVVLPKTKLISFKKSSWFPKSEILDLFVGLTVMMRLLTGQDIQHILLLALNFL